MTLPFRAVISDMDGTLLNGQHIVGDFTIATLEKLAQKGVDIILATGRGYTDVSAILNKMQIANAAMITSNGAQAHNLQGDLLYRNMIPEQIAFEIMQMPFDSSRICLNTYQNNEWFLNVDIPQMRQYHQDSGFDYQVVDFTKHHGKETEKVFFIAKSPDDLLPIEQSLKMRFGDQLSFTYSTPQCFEIMNKNVSKASALSHLLENKPYGLQDCIAFGDGMNDVEMLSSVGKGCVMQNADPRLLEALPNNERIGLHQDEAVASYLRAIFAIY